MKFKTYKDIQKGVSDLEGKYIENNILRSIDVSLIAHFGNIITCEIKFENCTLFSTYNLGYLLPDILKATIELLELSKEDGLRLKDIQNVPVRIVYDSQFGKAIGFGHFMKDEFLLVDDLIEMAKTNMHIRGESSK